MDNKINRQIRNISNSANLPDPEVYEEECKYIPWGNLISRVINWVTTHTPENAVVLDYMCGTGYLLSRIAALRPDLVLYGCSLDENYITYAKEKYPELNLACQDALIYTPAETPNIIICTAGLHHLPLNKQPLFIDKISSELCKGAYLLLGEILIREHSNEKERALAALELGAALVKHCLCSDAPESVTKAAFQVLYNDVFMIDEFKCSYQQIITMLQKYFLLEKIEQTWPSDISAYGDFLFFCKRVDTHS